MDESVILNSPILIALYGIALAVTVFAKIKKAGAFWAWAAAIIVMGTSALALVFGAGLVETATVIVIFIIINIIRPKEGGL